MGEGKEKMRAETGRKWGPGESGKRNIREGGGRE